MTKNKKKIIFIAAIAVVAAASAIAFALHSDKSENEADAAGNDTVNVPQFNVENAYKSIVEQCNFGPRVPNTDAHEKCADYIATAFEKLGYKVTLQTATLPRYDGVSMKNVNIFASCDTVSERRILISAHWDSRPWADQDDNEENHKKPVLAANDGASGVAVMLELARIIRQQQPGIAVDFVCFDTEDCGTPEWDKTGNDQKDEATWCLGSQYFAANLPTPEYRPIYAVNLDMVGGKGAKFLQEGFSKRYAPNVVDKIWAAAALAGYSTVFPVQDGGYATDDHLPLIQIAGIPTVDIIPCYTDYENSFGPTWHTVNDTMENIDPNTLKAVGQTMVQVLFSEK